MVVDDAHGPLEVIRVRVAVLPGFGAHGGELAEQVVWANHGAETSELVGRTLDTPLASSVPKPVSPPVPIQRETWAGWDDGDGGTGRGGDGADGDSSGGDTVGGGDVDGDGGGLERKHVIQTLLPLEADIPNSA